MKGRELINSAQFEANEKMEDAEMTLFEIINNGLILNGYEGLRHPDDECSCLVDNIGAECNMEINIDCIPGHRVPCPEGCDCGMVHIAPGHRQNDRHERTPNTI